MNLISRLLFVALGGIAFAAVALGPASAHEADEFSFTGVANEGCLDPFDTSWSATWTIENFEGSNPFGIIDTEPVDVGFAPTVDDAAPGTYVPAGASATAVTIHDVAVDSFTLTVEHDVTNAENTFPDATVERPPACGSLTITKVCPNGGAGGIFAIGVDSAYSFFGCDTTQTYTFVEEADHTINEIIGGFNAALFTTTIDCSDGTSAAGTAHTVNVALDEAVSCDVINTFNGVPGDLDGDGLIDLDIEIKNKLNNINQNINTNTNTNTNNNVNENTQNQTNDQNTNVSTGDVNVSSSGGSGTGTGTGTGN